MATINPLGQPINYAVEVQNPFEAAIGGFKLGAGVAEAQAAQQARTLALEQQTKFQTGLNDFFKKPPEERQFSDLDAILPLANKQQFDALVEVNKGMDKRMQDANKLFSTQVLLAAESDTKVAQTMLQEKLVLEKDPNKQRALQSFISAFDIDPAKASGMIELSGAATFGKDWYEGITKARDERRTALSEPARRSALISDAIKKGVDAEFAPDMAAATLIKEQKAGLAPSVQEAIDYQNLTPEQKGLFSSIQILKKPPAAVTNVNVTSLEKTGQQELAKLMPDLYNQANSAADQLSNIPRYRDALDKAIVGPLADQRLSMAKVAQAIGFQGNKQGIEASRTLIQGLSEMTLNSRSLLEGQGAITGPEQDLLAKAKSGEVNFTKDELRIIFDVAERASRAQYKKSTNLLKSAAKESPTAQMFLENVSPLQKAKSANSITVGGQTFTRPANFTDAQWESYKQSQEIR